MTRTVLRDDGRVVLVTEHGLVLVDPDTGEAVETGLNAVAVTTDGTYAVNFTPENGHENSTAVEIIDVASATEGREAHRRSTAELRRTHRRQARPAETGR